VTLLQIDTPRGGFALGTCRNRTELGLEFCDEIGQLPLMSPDLFQPFYQRITFPSGFLEKPAKDESQAAPTIVRSGPREDRDLSHALFCRHPPRCEASYEIGDLSVRTPVAKAIQLWATPVCGGG
jgi:hypothetical protein